MDEGLPISALASAAFVAFVIEADNEAERRLAHGTTHGGARGVTAREAARGEPGAAWLTSLAMWFNCLRGLADGGPMTAGQLQTRLRLATNLDGMRRWGLITLDGVGRVARGEPRPRPRRGSMLALTERGRAADQLWRELPGAIEARWRRRFGADAVNALRGAAAEITRRSEAWLPDFLPIERVSAGSDPPRPPRPPGRSAAGDDLPLVSLLAHVLLQFRLDFERVSQVSLVSWSDLIRLLDGEGVRVRDLPARAGVSREAVAMLLGQLERSERVVLEPPANGRGRRARLSRPGGERARTGGEHGLHAVAEEWQRRYTTGLVSELRAALERITGDGTRAGSPLFAGLVAPPVGWRASLPAPEVLPWYPMVLHRGGFPDGS